MIETAAALPALDEICAVPGLSGVYVGPADLAISMGYGLADMTTAPEVLDVIQRIQATASPRVWSPAFTPTTGRPETPWLRRGFRMITLASESQALRRGAAEHLKEATGERLGRQHADDEGYS